MYFQFVRCIYNPNDYDSVLNNQCILTAIAIKGKIFNLHGAMSMSLCWKIIVKLMYIFRYPIKKLKECCYINTFIHILATKGIYIFKIHFCLCLQ